MINIWLRGACLAASAALCLAAASAHEIKSKTDNRADPSFDILQAGASTDGRVISFVMELSATAGASKPEATAKLPGAKVEAYVWLTKLDPGTVGFAKASGVLALAVTAHPDFDDTPLFDENADGDPANDGANWHSHWVVLGEDEACGAGLKVLDVALGKDLSPATAPGLPLALDSPGFSPLAKGNRLRVNAAAPRAEGVNFDAVTAALQVNVNGNAPLLCVIGVHKVASGNLSFPGVITKVN